MEWGEERPLTMSTIIFSWLPYHLLKKNECMDLSLQGDNVDVPFVKKTSFKQIIKIV